jgi:hypothetical protein
MFLKQRLDDKTHRHNFAEIWNKGEAEEHRIPLLQKHLSVSASFKSADTCGSVYPAYSLLIIRHIAFHHKGFDGLIANSVDTVTV